MLRRSVVLRPCALLDRVRRFGIHERGNVAMMFGISVVPIMALVGVSVDYAGAASLRQRLQAATDVTALAYARQTTTMTSAALLAAVNTYFKGELTEGVVASSSATITSAVVSADYSTLTLTSTAAYKPAFLGSLKMIGFGADTMPVSARTVTKISNVSTEVALVIDNSGSMAQSAGGQSKMSAAIAAAQSMVTTLVGAVEPVGGSPIKISLVPFTLSVNVGSAYKSASWMDTAGKSSIHWQNFDYVSTSLSPKPTSRFDLFGNAYLGVSWAGCVETRPGTYALNDTAATSANPDTLFVPMLAPDEPGGDDDSTSDYHNSLYTAYDGIVNHNGTNYYYGSHQYYYTNTYIDDNPNTCTSTEKTLLLTSDIPKAQSKLCKYKNASPSTSAMSQKFWGPNFMCNGQPLQRMIGDPVALRTQIGLMSAAGSTNLLEGFTWGWRTISPNTPFADGKAYGALGNKKYIVLLTDGTNSWNQGINPNNFSDYSPAGYLANNRLAVGGTTGDAGRAQLDAATLSSCGQAKGSPNNIEIFTVAFSVPAYPIDAAGQTLLQQCASLPTSSHAFKATDTASLNAAFQAIKDAIGQLRVSQ